MCSVNKGSKYGHEYEGWSKPAMKNKVKYNESRNHSRPTDCGRVIIKAFSNVLDKSFIITQHELRKRDR